jgi:hypothetical protein
MSVLGEERCKGTPIICITNFFGKKVLIKTALR